MQEMDEQTQDDQESDETTPEDSWREWEIEINCASKREEKWREYAKKIVKKYQGGDELNRNTDQFNILYSNVQVLLPAIYAKPPKPDVRRRYSDADPVGKQVAEILERCLSYSIEDGHFWAATHNAVFDGILVGRGVPTLSYSADIVKEIEMQQAIDPMTGYAMMQQVEVEKVVNQRINYHHIKWEDFRLGPGRTWDEVTWVAFRERLTKAQVREAYGPDIAAQISMSEFLPEYGSDSQQDKNLPYRRAEIWKIWDKDTRTVKHWSPGYKKGLLAETPDPYELKGFFPCPSPFYVNPDTNSTSPLDDFRYYRDQYHLLNRITERVGLLVDHARVRGVYDASIPEMGRMNTIEENTLIPANNARTYYENGGMGKAIWLYPIAEIVAAIQNLNAQKELAKSEIYEITGISDIMRGQSMASESATAQNIKNKFGTLRLSTRQEAVQQMCRDLLNMAAEIIADKFTPETLSSMSGIDVTPDLYELLSNETLRCYRIDVETDSTTLSDTMAEQQEMSNLLRGITEYMTAMVPLVQGGSIPIEAAKSILLAAIRRTKLGKTVEDAVNQIGTQQEMGMQQGLPQLPPQLPPEMMGGL